MNNEFHPFLYEVYVGNLEIVKQFLNENISLKLTYQGFTALHIAAQKGYTEIIEVLLAYGMEIDELDGFQQTALWKAAENGFTQTVAILLKHQANPNVRCRQISPLGIAIQNNHTDCANLLIESGCDINLADSLANETPLYIAIKQKNRTVIDALLSHEHVDCESPNINGMTPLMVAVEKGDENTINQLIKGLI